MTVQPKLQGRETVTAVETTGDAASRGIISGIGVSPDTVRRVAMRVMPFLLLCYFISFLDRINVAFAALQMNKAIGLTHRPIWLWGGAVLPHILPV